MLPCMNFVATRSIFDSFVAPKTARTNGTLERTGEFGDAAAALRSHEANAFDNVSEMIGHALREEAHGDSSGHIQL